MHKKFFYFLSIYFFLSCNTSPNNTIVPYAPSNLSGIVLSNSSVSLNWVDNSNNEIGFKIERRLNGILQFSLAGTVNTNITSFTDVNLIPNSIYEYRIYAYNSVGNSLTCSNVISLTTSGGSANFSSVNICNLTWTNQNLSLNFYRNGDLIPQVSDSTQWSNLNSGAWCWYNNDSANYWQYGKLYNWYALNDSRGLAPLGWHIPKDSEWNNLLLCVDPSADTTIFGIQSNSAGGPLKELGTTNWSSPNAGASNSTGFSAIPGGCRFNGGIFNDIGLIGRWWSTMEFGNTDACNRILDFSSARFYRGHDYKTYGFSVRLVKD
jgi:uncharacterized protein (TIGR02145 family)